ncbi:hypothetical protein ACLESO_29075, partial [Pyxidicoccus sp. 3LG]
LSALLAAVLVLSVPDLVKRHGDGSGRAGRELLHRVHALRSLGLEARAAPGESIDVLDARGGLPVYLGAPYQWVPPWTKRAEESLSDYLRRQRLELILLDGALRDDVRFAKDPELEAFFAEPGAFGYATWPVPGTDLRLALPESWATEGARRPTFSLPPSTTRSTLPPGS